MVSGAGIEPALSQSKCDVLPLDDPEMVKTNRARTEPASQEPFVHSIGLFDRRKSMPRAHYQTKD